MSVVFDSVNVSDVKLAPVRDPKASGCRTAKIVGKNGMPLRIQTPVMLLPWDITIKKVVADANPTCSVSMSFGNADHDEDVAAFKQFIHDFETRIKTLAGEMHTTLGKRADPRMIDEEFKSSIKESHSEKGDFPETFQAKVWLQPKVKDGPCKEPEDLTHSLKIFDMDCDTSNPQMLDLSSMKKGCPTAIIVKPSYVWCSDMGIGITWIVSECIVKCAEVQEECSFNLMSKGITKIRKVAPVLDEDRLSKRSKSSNESDDEGSTSSSRAGLENDESEEF